MSSRFSHLPRFLLALSIALGFLFSFPPGTLAASGTCGTGSWTSGNLEIHHINIGQGDSTLIASPTGKSLLFDAGETYWNSHIDADTIGPYIQSVLGCKQLDYVVISHFHVDHIGYVGYGGLWNLVEVQGFTVGTTLLRDYNTYLGSSSNTFTNWKTYLEGSGLAKLHPVTAIEGTSQVNLGGGVAFNILTVDGNGVLMPGNFSADPAPPSENDYSIGALISYGAFDEWLGGDLDGQFYKESGYSYHDIELSVAREVGDVDVYRVHHHGSDHSNSATFVNQLNPEVSIISVGSANTYGHPRQIVMNLLNATNDVYLTERGDSTVNIGAAVVAGNVIVKTSNGNTYTVNGNLYTATEPVRTDLDGDGYFAEVDPNDNNSFSVPSPNGGCDPDYQVCLSVAACQVSPGQVVINEVLPAPSGGAPEWVELYNTTGSAADISYCYIDDIAGGGKPPYQIPAGTILAAHGFWTLDRTDYFNNTGDDVRFLKEDSTTVLDSYTYGSTAYDVSWYRYPDGGSWAASPTSSPTKGSSNGGIIPVNISGNAGVAGATLSYTDGTSKTAIADGSGNYSFTVSFNWSGTVTPSLAGYSFTPASRSYTNITLDQTNQDYTAIITTFADVPSTYWAWDWIERLYNAGITTGCSTNPLMYCPENSVTRAQMAIFLERGIHGSTYQPPAVGAGTGFNDVPTSHWAAAWIKQLATDGITTGCGGGNYCPEDPVTRAQMAIFLLRSKYGAAYIPSGVGSSTGFNDVPVTHWAAAWIKQLAAEGITTGCGGGNYCPEDSVTRAQMAVFLVRTFNFP